MGASVQSRSPNRDGDRLVGGLSGGERQALAIGRAVYFGANVLILDEPTAALGVKEATHVLRIIMQARQKGLAVILVTHNFGVVADLCDRVVVMQNGRLVEEGPVREILREPKERYTQTLLGSMLEGKEPMTMLVPSMAKENVL